jgi:hypothetical protein
MPGEGGLLVTTFPHGGADRATGKNLAFAFYFNECWTGFEYQVAAQMLRGFAGSALGASQWLRGVRSGFRFSGRAPCDIIGPWPDRCGSNIPARSIT